MNGTREMVALVLVIAGQVHQTSTFSTLPASTLQQKRLSAAAVRLADGTVLISGGYGGIARILASAEIFDPATNRFIAMPFMKEERAAHTATPLADGRVLIAGGIGRSLETLASAELYDPATMTFTRTGAMNLPRFLHTATPLPDGRILIVGGGPGRISEAEIYDPRSGGFTRTGKTNIARYGHIAARLPNGAVLVAAADVRPPDAENAVGTAAAEVFDPVSGTFTPAGDMVRPRAFPSAAELIDGRVLIVSGNDSEIFDPFSGKFVAGPSLLTTRDSGATLTTLPSGDVLVAGGCPEIHDCQFGPVALKALELFSPATMTFRDAGRMQDGRTDHNAVLLADGRVLLAGGSTTSGVAGLLGSAEVFSARPRVRRRAVSH